jgi:hypothetical protein
MWWGYRFAQAKGLLRSELGLREAQFGCSNNLCTGDSHRVEFSLNFAFPKCDETGEDSVTGRNIELLPYGPL